MGAELEVDGSRPAVAWVSGLPTKWTSPAERLFLLWIALDTYDAEPPFEASPLLEDLARWSGVFKGSATSVRDALEVPKPGVRPALLEVARGTGRARSVYRLRTEVGPPLWSGIPDHKQRRSGPAVQTTTSGPAVQTTNGRSGLRSGLASGPAAQTTPYPSPTYGSGSSPGTGSAREDCRHEKFTMDGDCVRCGRQIFDSGAAS